MTTTAQKKGPAAARTAPDHGSINPQKDMEMNKHFSSTETRSNATGMLSLNDVQMAVIDLRHLLEVNKALIVEMPFERDGKRDVALDQISSICSIACTMATALEDKLEKDFHVILGGRS